MRRHGKPVIFLVHHLKTSDTGTHKATPPPRWERRFFHITEKDLIEAIIEKSNIPYK